MDCNSAIDWLPKETDKSAPENEVNVFIVALAIYIPPSKEVFRGRIYSPVVTKRLV